jgi:hypothetical protein
MPRILSLIAAGSILAAIALKVLQARKPAINGGWSPAATALCLAALAFRLGLRAEYWQSSGMGLMSAFCLVVGLYNFRYYQPSAPKSWNDALAGGSRLFTGSVWWDGAVFAATLVALYMVLIYVVLR